MDIYKFNITPKISLGEHSIDIPDELRQLFQLATYAITCAIISLLGIGANIVNICVFMRQGFKDSINISLLGLAVSDLACSITMFWTSICHNPLLLELDLPFEAADIMNYTGGWPHVCFNRITSLITSFITLERCLCIAIPLKVKTIITPFRTKVINLSFFLSMFLLFSPFYFVNGLGWRFSQSRNKSIYGLVYQQNREIVESSTFFIHSVFLSTALLLTVAICTVILVVKLNRKTQWRKTAVSQTLSKQENASIKERKVIKMITLISTIYIICYVPPTVNFLVMVLFPDFRIGGRLYNLLVVVWSLAFVLEALNSSVNICVYLTMSSKFQETLLSCLYSHKSR